MTPTWLRYVIEDEAHDETLRRFDDLALARERLRQLAAVPWDAEPNLPPCLNWRECGRRYELVTYDVRSTPWIEVARESALSISARALSWLLAE